MRATASIADPSRGIGSVGALPPFVTFFEEHRAVVYRYLALRVGPVDADDCFQETFLSALKAYPRLAPDSSLRAWVLKIAERKAIDAMRARARRPLAEVDVPERAGGETSGIDPHLWKAVKQLPPKQQAAIAQRFIADLTYAEIATSMGTSEEAARQNVREGLKKLRKGLGK